MTEKRRIACFFTAGYTELNAMKAFMRKINDTVEYIQLCPIGPRKSRSAIQNRHIDRIDKNQNGMTGEKLIQFEDDKDNRFLSIEENGIAYIDENRWKCFKDGVAECIRERYPSIPVIFFYAAPEVEAWFLADWENSFGSVYKNTFTTQQNDYFSVKFRKYVNDCILTDRYKNCIEKYGYFEGKYRKLSEEIQDVLERIDFLGDYMPELEHPIISYSKKIQGDFT